MKSSLLLESDLEAVACRWITRRDRGLGPQEVAELNRWLVDPRHARAFAAAEATWVAMTLAKNRATQDRIDAMLLPRPGRRAPLLWFSTAATAAAAALALLILQPPDSSFERAEHLIEYHTAPADAEARIALPDGSVAVLHRGAQIAFAEFPSSRRARLVSGEAHFTVSKTSACPFFVHVGKVTVRDIGTAFNVRLDPDRVAVLVTEGSVEVSQEAATIDTRPPSAIVLILGQEAIVDTRLAVDPEVSAPSAAVVDEKLAWKRRRLIFDRTPLATAIAEVNRYNVRQLSLGDPSFSGVLVAGGVQADDLDAFVGLLEASFGLTVKTHGNDLVLRKGP